MKLKSPIGLNPAGSGPRIFRFAVPSLLAGIIAGLSVPDFTHFPFAPSDILVVAGWMLIAAGTIVYAASIIQFVKGFTKGRLVTTGVYRYSRNPIYSCWILFLFPGISLASNNWIFMLSSLMLYVAISKFIGDEEQKLLQLFGKEYELYKKGTGRILSIPGRFLTEKKLFNNTAFNNNIPLNK